ncbi:hypothetical protein ACH6EH_07260 [Paenibacillus sp. JSM ZJ436]|uniref:hypothetical protein n=1 Tax=Paenibacillus sp. JSM ZJ436 TaxID=3376190 RepID=UPI0037B8BC4D
MKDIKEFTDRIELTINKLSKQREFIMRAINKPELLFDKTSEMFHRKDAIFQIMSVFEDGQRKMHIHEFQDLLASIVIEFFRKEVEDERIIVKLKNPNTYPSIFAVYYDDCEVMQFNIFERYYGMRYRKSREEIEKHYSDQVERHHESLERINNKLLQIESFKKSPIRYIFKYHKDRNVKLYKKLFYGLKELLSFAIFSKRMAKTIDEAKIKYVGQIEESKERQQKYYNLEEDLEKMKLRDDVIAKVEPIFIKYNYRLETDSHRLY